MYVKYRHSAWRIIINKWHLSLSLINHDHVSLFIFLFSLSNKDRAALSKSASNISAFLGVHTHTNAHTCTHTNTHTHKYRHKICIHKEIRFMLVGNSGVNTFKESQSNFILGMLSAVFLLPGRNQSVANPFTGQSHRIVFSLVEMEMGLL